MENTGRSLGSKFNLPGAAGDLKKKPEGLSSQFAKVSTFDPMMHEFIDKRIVRLVGPITEATAVATIAMLQLLDDISPNQDIELRINSGGGSVTAGLAIFDAMKNLHCDVKTVCEGEAMSMAAFLLTAGTPGKRFAMPNSTIMMHDISSGMEGSLKEMKVSIKEANRLKEVMLDIYEQYSGLNRAELERLTDGNHFMTANEAKSLGLIDDVIQPLHKAPRILQRPQAPGNAASPPAP